jgi:Ca2+-binding RTX toxin-like protein
MHLRFRLLVFASCLLALALGGFFDGHARADIDNVAAPPAWQCRSILGTFRSELIYGTNGYCDWIHAAGGDDTVYGFGVGDRIYGERGGDFLRGGAGNDLLVAGCELNACNPGTYGNWLYGGDGNDVLGAKNGYKDYLYGGAGTDTCYRDSRDVLSSCEIKR